MAAADTLLVPEQWTYDGRFRDMSGLRCADAVKTSFDTGLLEGRQADRFDAVSELTNAQILVISARLYDRLTGGSGLAAPAVGEAWYQSALTLLSGLSTDTAQSAMSRSVLQAWRYSEGTDYPQQPCTRSDFAALLLLVLDNANVTLPEINTLERDVPDLTAGSVVYELYLSGVLNGGGRWASRLAPGGGGAFVRRGVPCRAGRRPAETAPRQGRGPVPAAEHAAHGGHYAA